MFINYWFIVFASCFFPFFWLCHHAGLRKISLLCACLIFHYRFATAAGVLPIVFLSTLTYLAGISRIKRLQTAVILLCISTLIFYKYAIFLLTQCIGWVNPSLSALLAVSVKQGLLSITPPLAISFFVFEFVHYLVDMQRGKTPIYSLVNFTLFASFWPSVVAGPIKRFEQFIPALMAGCHTVTLDDIKIGLLRVLSGCIKKCVFADNLTGYIDYWHPQFATLALTQRWLLVFAISFRILFDFSGYSDIAIGCARMLGIQLPENFNWPYLAANLQTFWRRWHMSLSSWIRDYIYIPLGGNRSGALHKIKSGILAFLLCGLWHGAGWNFIFWGLYHGIGLLISVNCRWIKSTVISTMMTFIFVSIGWLFFFYPITDATRMVELLVWQ